VAASSAWVSNQRQGVIFGIVWVWINRVDRARSGIYMTRSGRLVKGSGFTLVICVKGVRYTCRFVVVVPGGDESA